MLSDNFVALDYLSIKDKSLQYLEKHFLLYEFMQFLHFYYVITNNILYAMTELTY